MKTTNKIMEYIKSGFFKGVGLGVGLLTTSIFAAAAAINVFSPGQVISAAQINQNFAIAAPEGAVMAFYLTSCPDGWRQQTVQMELQICAVSSFAVAMMWEPVRPAWIQMEVASLGRCRPTHSRVTCINPESG